MPAETKIEPSAITRFLQLPAVWMAGLVLLVGSFIGAAIAVTDPSWLRAIFAIAAVVIVLLFSTLIFLMQTKYRHHLLEDSYYAEYLERQEKYFSNFHPENISPQPSKISVTARGDEPWEEREQRRIKIYKENHGLFLVHTWRPSHIPGQVADVAISLHQHGEGPLSEGKVKSVEYHLGRKFFDHPVVKTNAYDNFRLDISAYGPVLCLARVNFTDRTPALALERYINF